MQPVDISREIESLLPLVVGPNAGELRGHLVLQLHLDASPVLSQVVQRRSQEGHREAHKQQRQAVVPCDGMKLREQELQEENNGLDEHQADDAHERPFRTASTCRAAAGPAEPKL